MQLGLGGPHGSVVVVVEAGTVVVVTLDVTGACVVVAAAGVLVVEAGAAVDGGRVIEGPCAGVEVVVSLV